MRSSWCPKANVHIQGILTWGAKERLRYILINVEVSPRELRTTSSFRLNISIVLVAVLFTTFASSALSMFKLITLPLIVHVPRIDVSVVPWPRVLLMTLGDVLGT